LESVFVPVFGLETKNILGHPETNKQSTKQAKKPFFFPRRVNKWCKIQRKAIQNLPSTHIKGGILNQFLKIKGQEI